MELRKMMNELNLEETISLIEMDLAVEYARVSRLEELLSEAKTNQRLREMVEEGCQKLESLPGQMTPEEYQQIVRMPETVVRRALDVRSKLCEFHEIKRPAALNHQARRAVQ